MQLGFYYDQSRCIGCHTCSVACKDWNDVPPGLAAWRRMITLEQGAFPSVKVIFSGFNCFHCAQPACIPACPTQAIYKRQEDGIVVVNQNLCIPNCQACLYACPYQAPQFREDGGKMEMCNFCFERTARGMPPVCVEACPQRALDAGPLDSLKKRYRKASAWAEGYPDPARTQPSLLIKALRKD
ncbi:MAG: 4Fe-4S dicluster domain-containing protein [Chloroflexi bacterium]|nr:4Fe-4S dicluster domain-containing protein [Chloroflexota bacterium]